MITARQFRNGVVVLIDNVLHMVLSQQHTKPGKGGAFVRAKLKNLQNGTIAEKTYRPDDSFKQAYIEEKKKQFLYKDQMGYHFMDQTTYEQLGISEEMIGDNAKYLKDGMEITASMYNNSVVGITLPSFVELKVTYTEPGIKGDTAKGGFKPATVETGATVRVPLFINNDETIKVDTRTGDYAGRA
ncbi:MAG: elongation factor P [Candidatus Omnitrophota bacterium]